MKPLLKCPKCGATALSEWSNFCHECREQLRELSPEIAAIVRPEEKRWKPMPVVEWLIIENPEKREDSNDV